MTKLFPIAAITIILTAIGFYYVHLSNEIIQRDELIKSSWAQVDSVMQRRYDLIPNLVNTTKAYMAHEKDVLETLAKQRTQWAGAVTPEEKVTSAEQLDASLAQLRLAAENYPELKASQSFTELNIALEGSENRIAAERRRYNEAVQQYNLYVQKFPGNLFGYPPKTSYYAAVAEAKLPVERKF